MKKKILKKNKNTQSSKTLAQYMNEIRFWAQIALQQQAIIHAKNRT